MQDRSREVDSREAPYTKRLVSVYSKGKPSTAGSFFSYQRKNKDGGCLPFFKILSSNYLSHGTPPSLLNSASSSPNKPVQSRTIILWIVGLARNRSGQPREGEHPLNSAHELLSNGGVMHHPCCGGNKLTADFLVSGYHWYILPAWKQGLFQTTDGCCTIDRRTRVTQ